MKKSVSSWAVLFTQPHYLLLSVGLGSTSLFSCSSNKGAAAVPPLAPAPTVSPDSKDLQKLWPDNFTARQQVNILPSSQYSRGCAQRGVATSKFGFDEELRPGDQFIQQIKGEGIDTYDIETNLRVVSASRSQLTYELNYQKLIKPELQGYTGPLFSGTPNLVSSKVLTLGDQRRLDLKVNILQDRTTSESQEYQRAHRNENKKTCWLRTTNESTNSRIEEKFLGTTRFMDRDLEATKVVYTISGEVVCSSENRPSATVRPGAPRIQSTIMTPGELKSSDRESVDLRNIDPTDLVSLGMGSRQMTLVASNAVASTDYDFCGGTKLYSSQTLKLNDGSIVQSQVIKYIEAPLAIANF